jgi:adenylate cyclase
MRVGPEVREEKAGPRRWQKAALAALVVLIVAAGAWAIWTFYFGPPPMDVASVEKMAFPLPEKPSVAVLPFTNMSGDPEQEYIADGITENIITALSKVPDMLVIARNSTFTYKGKPVKVQQIAEELSVQYVLEGSVQKSESRLRITVQLVDAIKGRHVWAERYDRDLKDIFALQDEITMKVIAELQVELTEGDKARRAAKGTNNLEAYLKFLKANQLIRYGGKEKIRMSRKILKEVIALDPEFPMGYLLLGWTHSLAVMGKWSESPKESMARAKDLFQKGLELDDSLDLPHRFLGAIYAMSRQWDRAVAELERAVSIAPYSTNMWALANALKFAGRPEEAIAWYKKAFRLDPITSPGDHIHLGMAYFMAEQFENALAEFKRVLEHSKKGEFNPIRVHITLAATYAMLGREEEARNHAAEVLRINPKFSLKWATKRMVYKKQADIDRYVEALRKAGLK